MVGVISVLLFTCGSLTSCSQLFTAGSPTVSHPVQPAAYPAAPPAVICGNSAILDGPSTPPSGAVVVAAGDSSSLSPVANTTYWFAPGVHTLGTGQFGQIVPRDNDVFIGAPGAILDGGHVNRYAFTQHASGVTVEYLTIRNFGPSGGNRDEGVVNHDSGHNWTIQYNTVTNNAGAGVFIGTGNTVHHNCLSGNEQYGFSSYESNGDANIVLDHNEISGNDTYDWNSHIPGCGCVGGGKFWNTNGATVTNNWVHDNKGQGLWADTNDNDFNFDGNYINNNDSVGLAYEISYNARIVNNTFIRNALVSGPSNPGFPTGAVYLSEAGGDARVGGRYTTIEVANNQFIDNWSGVVGWENADRFCGSPSNTSSGFCTLGNPTTANLSTCVSGTIINQPHYGDCRWKSQNISVHDNYFSVNPAAISGCTPAASCGLQGLFSNSGTSPQWSPYMGRVIEDAVTFTQNNHFTHNTYTGPWTFMAHDQGTRLCPAAWQGAPYNQDAGSTFPLETPSNLLNADTATLEGSVGNWVPWYSSTATRDTTQANSGTASLKATVTASNGWGVQLSNYPGPTACAGPRTASFWARAGSPSTVGTTVTMTVRWKDLNRNDLLVTTLTSPPLSTTWQQATTTLTTPPSTATAYAQLTGNGVAGDNVYFDDLFVGMAPQANLLNADTTTLEGSVGNWVPWYSSTATRDTTQANSGTASLKATVTASNGWGVQLSNYPGPTACAGPRTASFWARAGSPSTVGTTVTMTVRWKDLNRNDLLVTTLTSPPLSTTWQQATTTLTTPPSTATAYAQLTGNGVAGDNVYFDDLFVG